MATTYKVFNVAALHTDGTTWSMQLRGPSDEVNFETATGELFRHVAESRRKHVVSGVVADTDGRERAHVYVRSARTGLLRKAVR